ncbi:MAG: AAA family ATPase [Candidatus Tectomicrobia bacterium]|nr:AAA family ATPase [Candidatus Tectomicrobia bacterium]
MDFLEMLDHVIDLLRQRGRVTYGTLKRQFNLDDKTLEDLKIELIEGQRLVTDEKGTVLVWRGAAGAAWESAQPTPWEGQPVRPESSPAPPPPDAERRHLTVMFCDLVGFTPLSEQLDPEDLRDVVRAYQYTCAAVVQRFDGYIAQYLGDGLLVYFGYPQAHEDDVLRAGYAGLGIIDAIEPLNDRLAQERGIRLAGRVGIHTGPVVVGVMGEGGRQERLALGETPNLAARLQGLAAPNTVVVSAATLELIEGFFVSQDLGAHPLKGMDVPLQVHQLLAASEAQTRLDAIAPRGLTPLVGRTQEVELLRERWGQSTEGRGQVVLLSGEAGIGKSRLVQVIKEHAAAEPHTRLEWRGSPYYQQSALYPLIAYLHRRLRWRPDDLPSDKLRTLEAALETCGLALPEVAPLFASVLSLPLPDRYAPLTLTPQRQKQKTLEAVLAWLLAEAARQPVLFIVEDLHWIDPSTLDLLTILIEQEPRSRILTLLTYRPAFHPPWELRAHLTLCPLSRLPSHQVEQLIGQVTGGKAPPPEVMQQIVAKTDGVPLFVEELTKMVLESDLLREREDRYELKEPLPPLAIPVTLQDSLMARLDRLATVKAVAQLGATIGRTFSYNLLQAISPLDALTLQHGLRQLVEAELVNQRGIGPRASYMFKHALIQDTAYQSLLRSTRQQYHQLIAQVLEAQFPGTAESQPELLAHHYTEAGCSATAIPYWQQAGQRAIERSANLEAIGHSTKGLEVLKALPETPERIRQELSLQVALSSALMVTRGFAAPEVEQAYARAHELCQRVEVTPQLFLVLGGLRRFYLNRGALQTARELAEQAYTLAQSPDDPEHFLRAHHDLGSALFFQGEVATAHAYLTQGMALYEAQRQHHSRSHTPVHDAGVGCCSYAAWCLWVLGYPAQALQKSHETLTLAQELSRPYYLAHALYFAALVHQFRREEHLTRERAEAAMAICAEQGYAHYLAAATILQGWAQAAQGQDEAGLAQLRQGLAAAQATGAVRTYPSGLLAERYWKGGQANEGLHLLAETLAVVDKNGERWWAAELLRLKGELLLQQAVPATSQAETCFRQALDIARRQQAKSWELRAAMSLNRLWRRQGKRAEARELLAEVYGWFTEGFDTADLQEAKALLNVRS